MSLSPRDVEAVRARLRADPNTALIAQSLELSLDGYIEQVMLFVLNSPAPERGSSGHSGFTPAHKPKVALDQVRASEGVDAGRPDPALKAELAEQMRRNRNKKG